MKTVKQCLHKTISPIQTEAGTDLCWPVNYITFKNLLIHIAAIMNSRPLLPSDDSGPDPDDWISPAKLVMGHDPLGPPFSFYECTDTLDPQVRQKLKERNEIVRKFWNKYMEQYIPALQKSHKWKQPEPDIQINDIVMVRPDTANLTLKRPYWRKGRVVEVRKGRDNKIRNLKVFLPIRYTKSNKKIINSIITCPVTDVVHTELQATGEHIRTRKLRGTYTRNEENPEEGRWSYLKDTEPQDKKAPPDPPA